MSEELAVRPAQLRRAPPTEKIQHIARQIEKGTPALAANGRVAASEKTLRSADKLDARARMVRAAATAAGKAGGTTYGSAPGVTDKGGSLDIRVY